MNTNEYYFDKLNGFNDEIGVITIDQTFVDHRTRMMNKFASNGRPEWKRLMHADCLVAEYNLIHGGFVIAPPTSEIRYDFKLGDAYFDAKFIETKYFNISLKKFDWYMENIMANVLTHFAFYKYVIQPESFFKGGEKIQLRLLEVEVARDVIKRVKVSRNPEDGYYYCVANCK